MKSLYSIAATMLSVALLASCNGSQNKQPAGQSADSVARETAQPRADFGEKHRPQFHFSPPRMWMNDPNGMVYYDGEYHLFYQHYPDSTVWGPMHWGHAVSKDMIHWEHLPIALYPDSLGYIFSGSAVVDQQNTSGLGTPDNPPMVAIFTYHLMEGEKAGRNDYQTQGLAYSLDKGRTWKKYERNPVLPSSGIKDFRDPKVFWHDGSRQWIMTLAVTDHVELYGSKDLKSWQKLSEFGKTYGAHGGVWECPDLFPLTVEGKQKWVLLLSINPGGLHGGSATQYFVGHFDGKQFTSDNPAKTTLWLDYGKDNYAGVTWSNIPASDGRRLFLGWMSNWQYANVVPTKEWRSAMTIPRELSLARTKAGIRLIQQPVKELSGIRAASNAIPGQSVNGQVDLTGQVPFARSMAELVLEFDSIGTGADFGIELSNAQAQKIRIGFDAVKNNFYIDRNQSGNNDFSKEFAGIHTAPGSISNGAVKMHLLIDVASVELFANGGEVAMTDIFFPDEPYNQIKLYAARSAVRLKSGTFTPLQSIWSGNAATVKQ